MACKSVNTRNDIVDLASLKLTNGQIFHTGSRDRVVAVVSQRFCLDLVLPGAEALKFADQGVAYHMRMFKQFSALIPHGNRFSSWVPPIS